MVSDRTSLIIDDDPDIVEVMTTLLELRGFRVETKSDGIHAVDLDRNYDVIVLDLNMPVFDGETLTEYWKLTRPEILERVIVLSGYSRFTRGRDIPAFANVPKPFDCDELMHVIEQCVNRVPAERNV